MQITLSGLTVAEVYHGAYSFCEDKEGNLGPEPRDPELVAEYVQPERLVALLEPHCNAKDNEAITLEVADSKLLSAFIKELENRIDIDDDNHHFYTKGRGVAREEAREAAAQFKASLKLLRKDLKALEALL